MFFKSAAAFLTEPPFSQVDSFDTDVTFAEGVVKTSRTRRAQISIDLD